MRIELVVANRGFVVQVNEYDICTNTQRFFAAHWFWRNLCPRFSVEFSADKHMADGRLQFGTSVNGKRTHYILQGPIQKLSC